MYKYLTAAAGKTLPFRCSVEYLSSIHFCVYGHEEEFPQIMFDITNHSPSPDIQLICRFPEYDIESLKNINAGIMEHKKVSMPLPPVTLTEPKKAQMICTVCVDGNEYELGEAEVRLVPFGYADPASRRFYDLVRYNYLVENTKSECAGQQFLSLINKVYETTSNIIPVKDDPTDGFISLSMPPDVVSYGEGSPLEISCAYAAMLREYGIRTILLANKLSVISAVEVPPEIINSVPDIREYTVAINIVCRDESRLRKTLLPVIAYADAPGESFYSSTDHAADQICRKYPETLACGEYICMY